MKFFETYLDGKNVTFKVGENGCKSIELSEYEEIVRVTVDNVDLGDITFRFNIYRLPFYATA